MKTSELIAKCSQCYTIAKRLDSRNHQELFQEAWLQVKEQELKTPEMDVKDYKGYFAKVLYNRFKRSKTKIMNHLQVDRIDESRIESHEFSSLVPSKAFLIEWLNKPTKDEDLMYYKNIITLVIHCKNTSDAIKHSTISRRIFYEALAEAKKRIKDDYFKT